MDSDDVNALIAAFFSDCTLEILAVHAELIAAREPESDFTLLPAARAAALISPSCLRLSAVSSSAPYSIASAMSSLPLLTPEYTTVEGSTPTLRQIASSPGLQTSTLSISSGKQASKNGFAFIE